MELAEIVMNLARQRIFQYFLLHETGTDKEIEYYGYFYTTCPD